jgi:hypothetical protein
VPALDPAKTRVPPLVVIPEEIDSVPSQSPELALIESALMAKFAIPA